MKNATKILIKRGERKRRLPPPSPPVGEEEREAGEVAGREREKERQREVFGFGRGEPREEGGGRNRWAGL